MFMFVQLMATDNISCFNYFNKMLKVKYYTSDLNLYQNYSFNIMSYIIAIIISIDIRIIIAINITYFNVTIVLKIL